MKSEAIVFFAQAEGAHLSTADVVSEKEFGIKVKPPPEMESCLTFTTGNLTLYSLSLFFFDIVISISSVMFSLGKLLCALNYRIASITNITNHFLNTF